jgi:lipopolysaccharide biosynthesis regulator YciM
MMPEILFLLLPVAALSGWLVARASYKRKADKKTACAYEPAYYKGLNFLLNEQPDKAIDVFIDLLEVDSETVETHLALGSLFRKRGEVDRAIRIHQNLIARPSLDQEQRANALLELGQDYMNAGLFDRAENLFTELYETGKLQKKALENLKEIYQQEKVWDKCLTVVKQLESYTGKSYSDETAHYNCELAELSFKTGEISRAAEFIKKAKQSSPDSVRALLMEARLEESQQHIKKALKLYQQIIETDQVFVSEILPGLINCYRQNGSLEELQDYLGSLFQRTHDTAVLEQLVSVVTQGQGIKAAMDYLVIQLADYPSLKGLQLLHQLKSDNPSLQAVDVASVLGNIIDIELSQRPAYACRRCGYEAKTLHWQCPGCRSWGTIKPALVHES